MRRGECGLLILLASGVVIASTGEADAHRRGGVFFGFSSGPAYPYYYAPPPVYYPRPYYGPRGYYVPPPTYYVAPPVYYPQPRTYYVPPPPYYGPRWGGW